MRIRPKIFLLGLLTSIFASSLGVPTEQVNCEALKARIEKAEAALEKYRQGHRELSSTFSQSVEDHMSDQAEGVLNEITRNKVLKVSYARKKLAKRISAQSEMIRRLTKSFCESCDSGLGNGTSARALCEPKG